MSTPQAKRRRLDAASTLSKPFKSPFKTPLKAAATPTSQLDTPTDSRTASTPSIPTNKPLHHLASSYQTTASTPTTARKPRHQISQFSSPISTAKLNADLDIAALLKRQRELERELREVKEELDIVDQARKIEVDSEKKGGPEGEIDGELKALIRKWKGASRGAAEELFGGVKDRVNRMGGPRAWKEMQKRQQEFHNSYDAEPVKKPKEEDDESDEDDDDEERMEKRRRRDFRDKYGDEGNEDVEVETEIEREQRGGNEVHEDEGAEDEFTMAMMLKTLNIDLKLIGYDKEAQRWVD